MDLTELHKRDGLTHAECELIAHLVAWRDNLPAATNVQPENMIFMVPEQVLPDVGTAFSSKVIHADVTEPMVALPVPKIPGT